MIGRLHHVVLDCPDPAALAAFYSELLELPITYRGDDWVVVSGSEFASALQGIAGEMGPTKSAVYYHCS